MTEASLRFDEIKLSSTVTISRYQRLEADHHRDAIADFIRARFTERYITPLRGDPEQKHGFCTMAICCLMIETLESFWQGVPDSTGRSKGMFIAFFKRPQNAPLGLFAPVAVPFYTNVRCGILHQAETKGGWQIHRSGQLYDPINKRINATAFHNALEQCLINYCDELRRAGWDDEIWVNARKKVTSICNNCLDRTA